jgi:hypothetical protein
MDMTGQKIVTNVLNVGKPERTNTTGQKIVISVISAVKLGRTIMIGLILNAKNATKQEKNNNPKISLSIMPTGLT